MQFSFMEFLHHGPVKSGSLCRELVLWLRHPTNTWVHTKEGHAHGAGYIV